jgi:hypothetical protein
MSSPIEALRTSESRFDSLPFFPYAPSCIEDLPSYEGLRLHYLDVSPDALLGKPEMDELRGMIRGCAASLELPQAGHFVQAWGDVVARAALEAFGDA